jgi:hypothetical protein
MHKNVLLTLMLCLSAAQLAAQDEDETEKIRDARIEFLKQTTLEEMRAGLRNEVNLRLDDIRRHLKLEEEALRKPHILAKGVARKAVNSLPNSMQKLLSGQHARIDQLDSFIVNGRTYQHQDVAGSSTPEPALQVLADSTKGWLRVQFPGGNSTVRQSAKRVNELTEMEFWPMALKDLEEEQSDQYTQFESTRQKSGILDGVVSVYKFELKLDEEQEVKMRNFLFDKMPDPKERVTSLDNIRAAIKHEEIYESSPAFLSEAQLTQWKAMQSTLGFGW